MKGDADSARGVIDHDPNENSDEHNRSRETRKIMSGREPVGFKIHWFFLWFENITTLRMCSKWGEQKNAHIPHTSFMLRHFQVVHLFFFYLWYIRIFMQDFFKVEAPNCWNSLKPKSIFVFSNLDDRLVVQVKFVSPKLPGTRREIVFRDRPPHTVGYPGFDTSMSFVCSDEIDVRTDIRWKWNESEVVRNLTHFFSKSSIHPYITMRSILFLSSGGKIVPRK